MTYCHEMIDTKNDVRFERIKFLSGWEKSEPEKRPLPVLTILYCSFYLFFQVLQNNWRKGLPLYIIVGATFFQRFQEIFLYLPGKTARKYPVSYY
jgi:hypothetical protein